MIHLIRARKRQTKSSFRNQIHPDLSTCSHSTSASALIKSEIKKSANFVVTNEMSVTSVCEKKIEKEIHFPLTK